MKTSFLHTLKGSQIHYWHWRRQVLLHMLKGSQIHYWQCRRGVCLHTLKGSQIHYWHWRRQVLLHTLKGSQIHFWHWRRQVLLHMLKGSQIHYWHWRRRVFFAHVKRLTNTLLTVKKTSYKHANPADEQSIGLLHVSIKKQQWIPSINTISTSLNVIALVTFAARESTLWRLDNGERKVQR